MVRIIPLLALLASTLTACQERGCVEVSRAPITNHQDPLLIGGTYEDVLTTIVSERSGTLEWHPSEQFVRDLPPPGETGITVEIHPPSMAWDIEIENRTRRNERLLCTHLLEVEFEVDLRSDDGMLDTSFMFTTTLDDPHSMWIYRDVTEHDLGPLIFDPINEDASLLLRLSYGSDDGPEGALILSTSSSDDGGSGAGMTVELATWTLQ